MLSVTDQAPTAGAFDDTSTHTEVPPSTVPGDVEEGADNDPDDSLDRDPEIIAAIHSRPERGQRRSDSSPQRNEGQILNDCTRKNRRTSGDQKEVVHIGPHRFFIWSSYSQPSPPPPTALTSLPTMHVTAQTRLCHPPTTTGRTSAPPTSIPCPLMNAQVIHENLVTGIPRPNPGPYHPSSGRVPPAGRHNIRRPTPGPENILFSDPARNHAGKKDIPADDLIVDRFPRDDEWDFANAPVCFSTLKQHKIEHSNTLSQTSPDAVIKAEAKFANGLLKAIAPYHHLVDSCLQDITTLLSIPTEDFALFRTVALQGLNDLTRLIAYLS